MRVHLFELLGSSERKWGVAGVWKIYPVELQDRARLNFPYTTYYHVESVLQKRLKRQDHPLLIVSIYIYNNFNQRLSCSDQSHLQKGTLSKQNKPHPHHM